jgi:purine-binding chemotaxis protein CheW
VIASGGMVDGPAPGASPLLRLVCFELRQQELAFSIADVRETLPLLPISHVFLTPPWLAGIFSLRGEIVPAIDLGVMLGLPRTEVGEDSKIVVVEHASGTAGIIVDRLRDLRTIDTALETPPGNIAPDVAALLKGVAATNSGTVRVLDAHAVLTCESLKLLAETTDEGRTP